MMVSSLLILDFFYILILSRTNNLSLGFRVGNFCDGGFLDNAYGFISQNLN